MNRETEKHFSQLPELHIPRSKFIKEHDYLCTWNTGSIIPIYVDPDILPGTTVNMKMSTVMRMTTPLYPTMGNMSTDILWFFIPYRLVWTDFKAMWGENTNAWYPQTEAVVPRITTTNGFAAKSLADYMGLPTGVKAEVSGLPFRCYVRVYNEWFRDANWQSEEPNLSASLDYSYDSSPYLTVRGGDLLKANKYHDYFTSGLPNPQYGPEVTLPLGTWAPVYPRTAEVDPTKISGTVNYLQWKEMGTGTLSAANHDLFIGRTSSTSPNITYAQDTSSISGTSQGVWPNNLWTDLSAATAASIQTLRQAIAIQHYYEAMARSGGGRYITFLKGIFGVTSSDASLQRSEYLGGKRIPMNIYQATSTAETTNHPLGATGAFSHTADADEYFTKSFEEHGCLLGLMVTRYQHSYQQGIPRGWSRRHWYDHYVPQLANLSEQEIKVKEIYAGTGNDDDVFAYQEAWAEYRYFPDTVAGEMRSNYTTSLDAWHYADDYASQPIAGSSWLKEDATTIDRTIAVAHTTSDQFWGDFYFKPTYVMPMPIYSVPGLSTI